MNHEPSHPYFSPSYFYALQELLLAEAAVRAGLTELRKGTARDRGAVYLGLFQFSTGLERLLKLVLVLDYMIGHDWRGPGNSWLKDSFGHDLESLVIAVAQLPRASGIRRPFPSDPFDKELLTFLSTFAKSTRYYNLDALSGTTRGPDPLRRWSNFLKKAFSLDVPPSRKRGLRVPKQVLEQLERITLTLVTDLDQSPLDLQQSLEIPQLQAVSAPYLVRRFHRFLPPIRDLLKQMSHESYSIPLPEDGLAPMPDMADLLLIAEASNRDILTRRRWR